MVYLQYCETTFLVFFFITNDTTLHSNEIFYECIGELLGQSLNWWLRTWWRNVAGLGSTGKLFAPVFPMKGGPRVGTTLGSYNGQLGRNELAAFWEGVLYGKWSPLPTGWVQLFFLCIVIGLSAITFPSTDENLSEVVSLLCEQNRVSTKCAHYAASQFFQPLRILILEIIHHFWMFYYMSISDA